MVHMSSAPISSIDSIYDDNSAPSRSLSSKNIFSQEDVQSGSFESAQGVKTKKCLGRLISNYMIDAPNTRGSSQQDTILETECDIFTKNNYGRDNLPILPIEALRSHRQVWTALMPKYPKDLKCEHLYFNRYGRPLNIQLKRILPFKVGDIWRLSSRSLIQLPPKSRPLKGLQQTGSSPVIFGVDSMETQLMLEMKSMEEELKHLDDDEEEPYSSRCIKSIVKFRETKISDLVAASDEYEKSKKRTLDKDNKRLGTHMCQCYFQDTIDVEWLQETSKPEQVQNLAWMTVVPSIQGTGEGENDEDGATIDFIMNSSQGAFKGGAAFKRQQMSRLDWSPGNALRITRFSSLEESLNALLEPDRRRIDVSIHQDEQPPDSFWRTPTWISDHPFGDKRFNGLRVPWAMEPVRVPRPLYRYKGRNALSKAYQDMKKQPRKGPSVSTQYSRASGTSSQSDVGASSSIMHQDQSSLVSPTLPMVLLHGDRRRINVVEAGRSIQYMLQAMQTKYDNAWHRCLPIRDLRHALLRSNDAGHSEQDTLTVQCYRDKVAYWNKVAYRSPDVKAPKPPIEHFCVCQFERVILDGCLGSIDGDPLGNMNKEDILKRSTKGHTPSMKSERAPTCPLPEVPEVVTAADSMERASSIPTKSLDVQGRDSPSLGCMKGKWERKVIQERKNTIEKWTRYHTCLKAIDGDTMNDARELSHKILSLGGSFAVKGSKGTMNENIKSPMDHMIVMTLGRYLHIQTSTISHEGPGCIIVMTRGDLFATAVIDVEHRPRWVREQQRKAKYNWDLYVQKENAHISDAASISMNRRRRRSRRHSQIALQLNPAHVPKQMRKYFADNYVMDLLYMMSTANWKSGTKLHGHDPRQKRNTTTALGVPVNIGYSTLEFEDIIPTAKPMISSSESLPDPFIVLKKPEDFLNKTKNDKNEIESVIASLRSYMTPQRLDTGTLDDDAGQEKEGNVHCKPELLACFSDFKVFVVTGYRPHLHGRPSFVGQTIWNSNDLSCDQIASRLTRKSRSSPVIVTRLKVNRFLPVVNSVHQSRVESQINPIASSSLIGIDVEADGE